MAVIWSEDFAGGALPSGWSTELLGDPADHVNAWDVADVTGTSADPAPSGVYCAGVDAGSDGYPTHHYGGLVTPAIDYSAHTERVFRWWMLWGCETGYQGWDSVRLMWFDGSSWAQVDDDYLNVPYNTTQQSLWSPQTIPFGAPVWSHESLFASWAEYEVDVDALLAANPSADETAIQFRWEMGSDEALNGVGMWVDSVSAEGTPDAVPPDPRDRWDPRALGLAIVSAGWTGSVTVAVGGVSATVTPAPRTSAAEVWSRVLARCRAIHGGSWEAWGDETGALTLVGEDHTEAGFTLSFSGNVGTRLGFAESSYSGQIQYTGEGAHTGAVAYGLPLIAETPHLSVSEGRPTADGSGAAAGARVAGPVTLRIFDEDLASALSRTALVGETVDIHASGRLLGRIRIQTHLARRRGHGVDLAVAELGGQAVTL